MLADAKPNGWLWELLEQNRLLCPKCRNPIRFNEPDLICSICQERYTFADDVAELIYSEPSPSDLNIDPYVDAIMARYVLPASERAAVERLVKHSFTAKGHHALAAEINMFVDRFALYNSDLRLTIVKHYISAPLPAGATVFRAIRIRNNGNFPWVPLTDQQVNLSYHLLRSDNTMFRFDGARTAIPVEILPGREVTVPMRIDTPAEPGSYILRVMLVRETLRWGDEGSSDIPIVVAQSPGAIEKGQAKMLEAVPSNAPFTTTRDSEIAIDMVSGFVRSIFTKTDNINLIEIGGGNSPESLMIMRKCQDRRLRILNVDLSASLLRLCALQLRYHDSDALGRYSFLVADANKLPLPDSTSDIILLFRALHHFQDPVHILRICRDKLKPNGFVALMCEPVGNIYDAHSSRLLAAGINEQVFALEDYFTMFRESGLRVVACRCDWGFSLKVILVKA